MSRYPMSPYPTGWFRVASSAELREGAVLSRRYFGREIVLFRSKGKAVALDAFCPHLGAHLGLGKVVDDTLQCPFHGWRFDGAGRCAAIPNAERPARVGVRRWPTRECNGVVMAWNAPDDREPEWEVPVLEEGLSPEWTGFREAANWRMKTHVQELSENGMDNAHFTWLHTQQTSEMTTLDVEIDGPTLVHKTHQVYNLFGLAKLMVDSVVGPLHVHCHGLGMVVNRATVHARIDLHYVFAFYPTPIDDETIRVHSMLSTRRLGGRLITNLLARKAMREGKITIDQDVPIWESKAYVTRPAVIRDDGPILQFRRWARQFYPESEHRDVAG